MAKNTGEGFRRGEVSRRSQLPNPLTDGYTKRNTDTGRFVEGKDGPALQRRAQRKGSVG